LRDKRKRRRRRRTKSGDPEVDGIAKGGGKKITFLSLQQKRLVWRGGEKGIAWV